MVAKVRQDAIHIVDQVLQHTPLQPYPSLAKVIVLALSPSMAKVDVHAPDLHTVNKLFHLPLHLEHPHTLLHHNSSPSPTRRSHS
eukprot:4483669-Heterocapsa_arctica.AAC.1